MRGSEMFQNSPCKSHENLNVKVKSPIGVNDSNSVYAAAAVVFNPAHAVQLL